MIKSFHSVRYGCAVYGNATLAVESSILNSVAFEIENDQGDQLAAVIIDKAHASRLVEQLQAMISYDPHNEGRDEQCADAAWYVVRFGRVMWNATRPETIEQYLRNSTMSRIICDAEDLQCQNRRLADRIQDAMVGTVERAFA